MGKILVKPGVDFGKELAPAGARILDALKQLVKPYDYNITITSAREGDHSGPTDPHKLGEAFDIRTKDLTDLQKNRLLSDLKTVLYTSPMPRFFAFLEAPGTPNEHLHVQRRKGTAYNIFDYLSNA